ncbi:MAG: CBS domain-containing protein, partial [Anaerolineae bacterium]
VKQLGTHRSIHTIQCIKKDALLTDALTRMNDDDFRFRHFLVTHDGKVGGKLEGIIGYRNILKKEKDPTESFDDLTVEDAMRSFAAGKFPKPTFVHLHETDSLQTALGEFTLRLNKEVGIELNYFYMSAIPIVDQDHRATGIITFKDVVGAMVRGEIPIPNTTVGAIMRKGEHVRVTPPTETPRKAKHKMLQLGQRDVVVVDNEQDRTFLGMVSDNERIVHSHLDIPVEDIMISHHDFEVEEFCLTSETTVAEMLSKYILTDYSKTFYDLPVISYRPNGRPHFEGLVGYRDVFLELARSNAVVYYQDVAP